MLNSYDKDKLCNQRTINVGDSIYTSGNGSYSVYRSDNVMYIGQQLDCILENPNKALYKISVNLLSGSPVLTLDYNVLCNNSIGMSFVNANGNIQSNIRLYLYNINMFAKLCYRAPLQLAAISCDIGDTGGIDPTSYNNITRNTIMSGGTLLYDENPTYPLCEAAWDRGYSGNLSTYIPYYCNMIKKEILTTYMNATIHTNYLCQKCDKQWKEIFDILTLVIVNCVSLVGSVYAICISVLSYMQEKPDKFKIIQDDDVEMR